MEYTSGRLGRVFAARLHDGEPVYRAVEEIARREKIESGVVLLVGGVRRGGVVVGPEKADGPIRPMVRRFDDAREIVGVGTVHQADGKPSLHLHGAIGRGDQTIAGCPREGLDAFLVLEVVIVEVTGLGAARVLDAASGLRLLTFAQPARVDLGGP